MSHIIGTVAACLTTLSFLPQAIRIVKTRDVRGISPKMYIIFTIGVFLWMIYGIMRRAPEIIVANSITFVLSATILLVVLSGDNKKGGVDTP